MRGTEVELRQADILFDFDVCGWPRKLNNLTRCKMPIVSVIAFAHICSGKLQIANVSWSSRHVEVAMLVIFCRRPFPRLT